MAEKWKNLAATLLPVEESVLRIELRISALLLVGQWKKESKSFFLKTADLKTHSKLGLLFLFLYWPWLA